MVTTSLDLHALLAKIARQDRDSLRVLFGRFATPVFSLAHRILGDRGHAEEVLQEVFVQVWRDAALVDRSRGSVSVWLVSVTRNRAVDRLRSLRKAADSVQHDEELLAMATPAADEDLGSPSEAGRVRLALAELPDAQREAVLVTYFRGRTPAEIAAAQSVPEAAARSALTEGLWSLRDALVRGAAGTGVADPTLAELLPLYALGDVTAEQIAPVEQALARDPRAREQLRALMESVHQMALIAPTLAPPATGFDRAWARIEAGEEPAEPAARPSLVGTPPPAAPSRPPRVLLPMLLVVAIAGALVLGALLVREIRSQKALQLALDGVLVQMAQGTQQRTAQARVVEALQAQLQAAHADDLVRMLQDPDLRLARLEPRDGSVPGVVRVLWRPGGQLWILVGSGLASPPLDREVRLWGLRAGQPVPAGVLPLATDGTVRMAIPLQAGLAECDSASITVEPKGGALAPGVGPTLFTGQL